ncbi:glycoside hydrolase family 18 protein [Auriscalpium vulgare]|uniref:Glycoside hydrolase family 18 protein n=1 Tax=Auriscalpium vulgare TaxID=40419 RepID=A0ACB8S9Z2_9AGAM|nr:glycoside hydrolase family 18 protein [Auriscalpium vulgare]
MAYYPDWVADTFPPERIDFARFDWIDFAFAVPNANFGLGWDGSDTAPDLLRRLVTAAHRLGKKVKLSVGGWTGSKYFSQAVANDQNRHTFVTNIVALYNQFGIDGIDIDWEYPGQPGNTGNVVSPADTANYFSFLTLLRASLPPAAKITAAVQTVPFADANGNPLTDASQFASVLDWVLLMNYDVWGSSSAPGPNAPLSNACHNSTQPTASADAAVRAWTAAGFPRSKLVLGVPSYGYVQRSGATRLRQRQAPDDSDAQAPSDDSTRAVTVLSDEGTADSGQVQFRDLVRQGALCAVAGAPGAYAGCGGFTRVWDACSSTPFLRSPAAGQVVTYDDAQSLGAKAQFVRANGVLGVNMFDVHGDTDRWDLVDALRKGLGLM